MRERVRLPVGVDEDYPPDRNDRQPGASLFAAFHVLSLSKNCNFAHFNHSDV
jgi:hypothetical protein